MKLFYSLAVVALATACGYGKPSPNKPEVSDKNVVSANKFHAGTRIGDSHLTFKVWSTSDNSLSIELPPEMLNSQILFGGTIIAVSDHKSAEIGTLKLTSTPVIHGRLIHDSENNTPYLAIRGCASNCGETTSKVDYARLPITREESGKELISFSSAAENLRIATIAPDVSERFDATVVSSRATRVDYSDKTLVVDTEETLKRKSDSLLVTLTVRWFVKLPAESDPWFTSRPNTDGIGYFTTETNANRTWIRRWSMANATGDIGAFHFFIKNVPGEWQPVFKEAIENWNQVFVKETGRRIIDYTFLNSDDPRNALIQTGDIRFNVIEWDLTDLAGYGGLGPSKGLQTTGQMINANVLVQGPTILSKYKKWFQIRDAIQDAVENNDIPTADRLTRDSRRETGIKSFGKITLTSKNFGWETPALKPELEDLMGSPRDDFYTLPDGESFESYMHGYFLELLGHEIGHTLGLRHNFAGNIHAAGVAPSASIMEYLARPFRFQNRISPYDIAAIKYGYSGDLPEHTDWFCTDENVLSPENKASSPECMKDDATRDPYSAMTAQLDQAIDYLINRGRPEAPQWNIEDVDGPLASSLMAMSGYAARAEAQAGMWAAWRQAPDRPSSGTAVKDYVLNDIKNRICSRKVLKAAESKSTPEAKAATTKNIDDLLNRGQRMLDAFKLPPVLDCKETN